MAIESDDKNPDAALHVRFQMISVYQPYDSTNALLPDGKPNPRYTGNPVYKDIPHIEITTPGGLNRLIEEVRPEHKARFRKKWDMFEMSQGSGDQVVGTKLDQWAAITRSRAEELRAMRYYTVEQIAAASDAQIQGLGMDGLMLRRKAEQFLKVSKDTAIAEKQAAELAQKNAELAAADERFRKLEEQMQQILAGNVAPQAAPKRKGRPPKVKDEPMQTVT